MEYWSGIPKPITPLLLYSNTPGVGWTTRVFSKEAVMKKTCAIILGLAWTLGVATAALSGEPPSKVRIAYASRSSSALPQYMAVQKGFFKAEGLDV